MNQDIENRRSIESRIMRIVVNSAIENGYYLRVSGFSFCGNVDRIVESLMATDDSRLLFYKDGKPAGSVLFVCGNSGGYDVICDYSVSLADVMTPAEQESDRIIQSIGA
jgi:hypothetical protein